MTDTLLCHLTYFIETGWLRENMKHVCRSIPLVFVWPLISSGIPIAPRSYGDDDDDDDDGNDDGNGGGDGNGGRSCQEGM